MIRILLLEPTKSVSKKLIGGLRDNQEPAIDVTIVPTVVAARRAVIDAGQAFDVFLIDLRPEPGYDGVDVFQELRELSPNTEGVIFSQVDDPEAGLRSYQVGAHRYLSQPFNPRELAWILRSLRKWQDTQYERDWLKIFTEIAEETQHALPANVMADTIVRGMLRLGFERAHLWRLEEERQALVDMSQGSTGTATVDILLADSPYLQQVLRNREPVFFQGQDLQHEQLQHFFSEEGLDPPVGEGVHLPLWNGERCWGVLTLDNAGRPRPIRPEQRKLLRLIGRQVAAALERVHLYERERRKSEELEERRRQLMVLHQARTEMMRLAEQDEDRLWHVTLTAATADYALGFNRAILLLAEKGAETLRVHKGIGYFSIGQTQIALGESPRRARDFEDYLRQLSTGELVHTPIEEFFRANQVLYPIEDGSAFQQVFRDSQRLVIRAAEAAGRLPPAFVERFGITDYALVPLQAGGKTLGLVVVDNMDTNQPLQPALYDLETLLAQAALALEALRQRRARDKLIDLNYTIMSEVGAQTLGETLVKICEAARAVTEADYAVIYPLMPSTKTYEYDTDNVGRSGNLQAPQRSRPRQGGISDHILRSNTPVIVPNVDTYRDPESGKRLTSHPSLLREHIRALIGVAVRDVATSEVCGVLYLNYRTPQHLTEQDIHQARSFASLAAVAIRNAWVTQKEPDILRGVLEQALAADTNEEKVVCVLLNAARALLNQPDLRVGLLLRDWTLEPPHQEPQEIRREYFLDAAGVLRENREPDVYTGIAGLALHTAQTQRTDDVTQGSLAAHFRNDLIGTHSEMDIPIRSGELLIGIFNVESPQPSAFSTLHADAIERLAAAAGLALDNLRRQKHLHDVLDAARAITIPTGLQQTLEAILEAARGVAPGLSTLTIWYYDSEREQVRLGPHFGVHHATVIRQDEPTEGGVVWRVMRSPDPIWASVTSDDPRLNTRFVDLENLKSTAAFPLRADGEIMGAMFVSYRQHHIFTSEEQVLFPILAAIAAASMRDAAYLEQAQKQRDHLRATMEVIDAVGATLDLDHTLHHIMTVLHKLFPHATPCVLTYDEVEPALEFTPASREFYRIDNPAHLGLARLPLDGASIACWLARRSLANQQATDWLDGDVERDSHYLKLILSTRSELCLTLMNSARLLGVLVLESAEPDAFQEADVALIRSIGQQISIALTRAYQGEQLRYKSLVLSDAAWAAEIAHDINREVGLIRNWADLLRDEPGLSEDGKQCAHKIDKSAASLAGTAGSVDPQRFQRRESIIIDEWLKQHIEEMIEARGSRVKTSFELGCGDLLLLVSPAALVRIVRALVINALHAMEGAGSLIVRTRRLAGEVEVQIEDTGPGLSAEIRQFVFKQPVSQKGKAGGLGLLFVRATIEAIGGIVRLLPQEERRGAVFAFRLPFHQEERAKEDMR